MKAILYEKIKFQRHSKPWNIFFEKQSFFKDNLSKLVELFPIDSFSFIKHHWKLVESSKYTPSCVKVKEMLKKSLIFVFTSSFHSSNLKSQSILTLQVYINFFYSNFSVEKKLRTKKMRKKDESVIRNFHFCAMTLFHLFYWFRAFLIGIL